MPTIDLYDPTAHADGWHDVRAPGGYEWWYFDAEDAQTDTQLVAIFMEGFIFHPGYLRAFARYLKRPTKTPPPRGGDFPCVYLCVYRGGKVWRQFFTQYRREDFSAARDRCEVTIGPNTLRETDGRYALTLAGTPWRLTGRGPRRIDAETLAATLTFDASSGGISTDRASSGGASHSHVGLRPRCESEASAGAATDATRPGADVAPTAAHDRAFLSRDMTGAVHRWTIAAPSCGVAGTLDIAGGSFALAGRGYHDHNFGTAPIGDGLARWTWGRAMFPSGRTVTFHHAEPADTTRPAETHVVEASADGVRDVAVDRVAGDWSRMCREAMFLRYPATLDFGDALRLESPRVVDPSPFYLRLQFAATSRDERATAFCEIAYPHRIRWPILGRMIEMSFDKRPLAAPAAAS